MNVRLFITITLLALQPSLKSISFNHTSDPYATHQPILYEIATNTTGPIIEFGCGNGSTDLLHEICEKDQRVLISVDDNLEWLNKYKEKYKNNSEWHKFYFVPGKKDETSPDHWITFLQNFELLKATLFSVCFIDQSPWLGRYETLKVLKNISEYVIVHDCNFFPEQEVFGTVISPLDREKRIAGVFDFSDVFTHFKLYFPPHPWPANTGPPTLVGSEFTSDFPEIDWDKY
jgi:hypothetical protein